MTGFGCERSQDGQWICVHDDALYPKLCFSHVSVMGSLVGVDCSVLAWENTTGNLLDVLPKAMCQFTKEI